MVRMGGVGGGGGWFGSVGGEGKSILKNLNQ